MVLLIICKGLAVFVHYLSLMRSLVMVAIATSEGDTIENL